MRGGITWPVNVMTLYRACERLAMCSSAGRVIEGGTARDPATLMTVSRETLERLDAFLALLKRWNRTLNLVSRSDLEGDLTGRHVAQSLALLPYFPAGTDRFIDLGSGGGFPALPIAIASGYHVDLIESDQRKAAFLQTALASLRIRGTVWAERIETCQVRPANCVTARALAPLSQLLEYANPLLQPGGVALLLKGDRAEAEMATARQHWDMQVEVVDLDSKGSRILKISRLEPADDPAR
jgi:16S rRNA (guanine527-N7)-methyltransferase